MGEMSGATVWHLPSEVLVLIFSFLPAEDIGRAASVCSQWSQVAEDRRVWRGKRFLSEGDRGLSDVFPIARALPVLKRVSISCSQEPHVYLNGELAHFEIPSLRDEAAASAISTLVTENLSVEFCLLEENCSNFLVVLLHDLKHLKISAPPRLSKRDTITAKLQAVCYMLCCEPLPNLQSVDIHTDCSFDVGANVDVDILGALSTCSALEHLAIHSRCFLSWHTVTEFSKLQFLKLQDCIIDDISFLDLCPILHSLSLDNCSPLNRRELYHKSELRSLTLRRLYVTTELVTTLCSVSPKLEKIKIDECQCVVHTLFLCHCLELHFMEVNEYGNTLTRVVGLPSGLRHLRLDSPLRKSDSLAEILLMVPRLEILDIISCNVDSLRFLRHCHGLTELSLRPEGRNTVRHFYELGGLRSLKKLHLRYNYSDGGPLADALCKMDQLESLSVLFTTSLSNFSFLRCCHRLHSLTLKVYYPSNSDRLCIHELSDLKELKKLVIDSLQLGVEDLEAFLPSMLDLEELCIGSVSSECNLSFLCHCSQLVSLQFSYSDDGGVPNFTQLRKLECLKRLIVLGLDKYWQLLAEEVLRLSKLEYLSLERDGPNLLESWEWRKLLSSLKLSAEKQANVEEIS